MTLTSIVEDDEYEGVYHATYKIDSAAEARSLSCRLGTALVIDLPDAQPPDVYSVTIPEEEARVNEPKGRRK